MLICQSCQHLVINQSGCKRIIQEGRREERRREEGGGRRECKKIGYVLATLHTLILHVVLQQSTRYLCICVRLMKGVEGKKGQGGKRDVKRNINIPSILLHSQKQGWQRFQH